MLDSRGAAFGAAVLACGVPTLAACAADAVEPTPAPCAVGLLFCDGACVDPATSDDHCGACDHPCPCESGTACFAGSCTTPSPMLTARAGHAAVAGSDGLVYVIGGHVSGTLTDEVEAFNPRTNRWSRLAPMLTPRTYLMAVLEPDPIDGDLIYAIAGSTTDPLAVTFSAVVEVYHVEGDYWSAIAPLHDARQDAAAALSTADGKIRVFFGVITHGATDTVETYDDPEWHSEATGRAKRLQHRALAGRDGKIYLCGGQLPKPLLPSIYEVVSDVEVFEPATRTWSAAPPMVDKRTLGGAAVGADERLYYAGGQDAETIPERTFQVYELGSPAWIPLAPMPAVRFDTAAAGTPDGKIYVLGGSPTNMFESSDSAFAYDPRCAAWVK
jgi:Kelch motif protein